MKIISNAEFVYLTEGQSPRLQSVAKERFGRDPDGQIEDSDVNAYKQVFAYSGDKSAIRWLDNLMIFTKNGTISRIKAGKTTWEDHVKDVSRRVAKGELPFDLGQHVQCKESGRYGSVVDYIPDSEEYLVVLNPFQVMTYKKGDLKKVAKVEKRADFMEPQVTEKIMWLVVDGPMGGESIPVEDIDVESAKELVSRLSSGDKVSLEEFPGLRDFFENNEIWTAEFIEGYGARLSAPGYMDRTEWTVFNTPEEAQEYLTETYEDEEF